MMMSNEKLTEKKLTEIEAVAKAATQGSWQETGAWVVVPNNNNTGQKRINDRSAMVAKEDRTHIATSDPPTVLSLIAEVRRLRECLQIAGIQAFMRDKPPEEVADHLRSVMASYVKAAEEAEVRVKELEAELRGE